MQNALRKKQYRVRFLESDGYPVRTFSVSASSPASAVKSLSKKILSDKELRSKYAVKAVYINIMKKLGWSNERISRKYMMLRSGWYLSTDNIIVTEVR